MDEMAELTVESVEELFRQQMSEWAIAHDNFEKLDRVKERRLTVHGSTIIVQCNPERIRSSAAKVDKATIEHRQCFLCKEHRPSEQRGIEWGEYTIIVNPYPIFPKHFTIPTCKHTAQRIISRFRDMMSLALLMKGYTVFYNGPECGASAPDHCHFQAGVQGFMPLEAELRLSDKMAWVKESGGARLGAARLAGHNTFVIEAADIDAGTALFKRLYAAMPVAAGNVSAEPMMNVLCLCTEAGKWTIAVIPRRKHRPTCYYAEGDRQLLVSPASVDLGGVLVASRIADFERITATDVEAIFDEVCITDEETISIIRKLNIE